MVTPMTPTGVDYDTLAEFIEFQIEEGINALVACGTTGESATLSQEERKEVKEQIVANREHGLKYMKLLCNSKRPQVQQAPTEQPRRYADRSEVKPVANRMTDGEQSIANRAKEICAEARKAGKPIDYYTGLKRARSEAESANKNNN